MFGTCKANPLSHCVCIYALPFTIWPITQAFAGAKPTVMMDCAHLPSEISCLPCDYLHLSSIMYQNARMLQSGCEKKSGWPSDISTRLSSHDDELHDFFQPCRGPIATWFLNGFEPLQTWISIMDYFIMRAYVNTYAICIYVIIYVFIGAPQIVRIPGMIQLGSWEFCWKYQLKQFHVLIHWYSYYTIDSKPCTHQPTIFIILPIIGERKKKRGQEKANTHCFRHWVCHIGVGSTLVNHPKLPACSCAHSLSVRCIIDAFDGL